jgi:Oxaloacetate decarboxylase, gamma chain
MKKIVFALLIIMTAVCFAEELKLDFPPDTSLQEISKQIDIPLKKLAEHLGVFDQTKFSSNMQELKITNADIEKAVVEFHENKVHYFSGIVYVGMGIVFTSLLVVGLIIASLQHIVAPRKGKKVSVKTPLGEVKAPKAHMNSNGIVAAITTILLHDADEEDNMEMTWKRQSISMWKAANLVESSVFERGRDKK